MPSPLRHYIPWLVLLLVISLLQAGDLYTSLRLPFDSFVSGQWYTLFSAHLVHVNLQHYIHNAIALLIIAIIVAPALTPGQWCITYCCTSLIVSLLLVWLPQTVATYAGLSGLLHGLFVSGCVGLFARQRGLAIILLLLLAGKLLLENLLHTSLLSDPGFVVVTHAHLYGVAGGLVSAALINLTQRRHQQQ